MRKEGDEDAPELLQEVTIAASNATDEPCISVSYIYLASLIRAKQELKRIKDTQASTADPHPR
jgi:hypothetical protein